jgi:hypothetical protein
MFGGSPCPNLWEAIGQPICDITNELIHNAAWDDTPLFDNISLSLLVPKRHPPDTPFTPALPLAVDIPIDDLGKGDIYIDDSIFVTPDIGNNVERVAKAVPLAINTVARPVHNLEPLPRKSIISQKKFLAKACFEENKIVLGWQLNTRTFTIHLPHKKNEAWSSIIGSIMQSKLSLAKQLHSLEGHLNHATYIIPTMRHFLNQIRKLCYIAEKAKGKPTTVPPNVIQDLQLCNQFLDWAAKGLSLNLITFRQPTVFHRSDACNIGLGGYNIYSGRAWRLKLPEDCLARAHINSLEFLATIITLWINITYQAISLKDCILSRTDNTLAARWLQKSNFDDNIPESENTLRLSIARKLGFLIIESSSCLYSQWFKRDQNNVADSLSRDHHLANNELCSSLTHSFPQQTPNGLKIYKVPNEILCWTLLMLQKLPSQQPLLPEPQPNTPDRGPDGNHSSLPLALQKTTTSWTTSQPKNVTTYLAPSWPPSKTTTSHESNQDNHPSQPKPTLVLPPWDMWHRPSRLVTDKIPDLPTMESL